MSPAFTSFETAPAPDEEDLSPAVPDEEDLSPDALDEEEDLSPAAPEEEDLSPAAPDEGEEDEPFFSVLFEEDFFEGFPEAIPFRNSIYSEYALSVYAP